MIYIKLVNIDHLKVQINIKNEWKFLRKKTFRSRFNDDDSRKIRLGKLRDSPEEQTRNKKTIQIFSYFYTNYYYSWGQIFIGVLFHSTRSCNRYVSEGGAGQTLSIKKTPTTRHRRIPFWNVLPLQPQIWQMLRLLCRRTREQPRLLSATRKEKAPLTPNIRDPKKKTVAH